ncbi:MAG: DUF5652 family protein [Candidatus Aenigmatarchaeota archaeon]
MVKIKELLYLILLPHIFFPLIVWSLFWKAFALWTAGTRKEKIWFIILFLINTLGVLEIIYLLTRKKIKKKR